jgi:hypothetical protein
LLKPGSHVRGITNRSVVHPQVVADAAYDNRPSIDSHADFDRIAVFSQILESFAYSSVYAQCCKGSSPSMILMGEWGPEQGHKAIAEKLIDCSLVAMHLSQAELEEPIEYGVHALSTEPFSQSGRVGDVTKEHSDELPLSFERAPNGQDLVS